MRALPLWDANGGVQEYLLPLCEIHTASSPNLFRRDEGSGPQNISCYTPGEEIEGSTGLDRTPGRAGTTTSLVQYKGKLVNGHPLQPWHGR